LIAAAVQIPMITEPITYGQDLVSVITIPEINNIGTTINIKSTGAQGDFKKEFSI
jgi:hypothetical protein